MMLLSMAAAFGFVQLIIQVQQALQQMNLTGHSLSKDWNLKIVGMQAPYINQATL